jgi:neutral ceramidase
MGNFMIGAGIHDITGPAVGRVMLGYSKPDQKTAGIHMRLRSRAFVIAVPDYSKYVALACADLDFIPQAVKLAITKKFKTEFSHPEGIEFDEKNVLLSGNHTHSSPGGYSHYALYNLAVEGFDEENFNCIVDGIYASIDKACKNLEQGDIYINAGDLVGAGWNRSVAAYEKNPLSERQQYNCINTNQRMTLLKFIGDTGKEIGTLNWFATHGTSLGNKNRLISGDNKGYACWRFEKDKLTDYQAEKTFVAAFAQAEEGDVSPNIPWGPPDGVHDFEHLEKIGNKQYEKAMDLYDTAIDILDPDLDYRHTHVKLTEVPVGSPDLSVKTTCPSAIGLSKAAGSTEDGPGLHIIHEGMNMGKFIKLILKLLPGYNDECHMPKQVVLYAGQQQEPRRIPLPGNLSIPLCDMDVNWTPEVMPLQIIRIGQLAILAVPCEFTTMSGRRLRETVKLTLAEIGIDELIVASCSNAFSGYVTTREEYSAQHYEGGSTQFGPDTLEAYQLKFMNLASKLINNQSVSPGPYPLDLTQKQKFIVKNKVIWDRKPLFKSFGSVHTPPQQTPYNRGDIVRVVFWGGNLKNHFNTQDSFLKVEQKSGDSWKPIAYDWDHDTRLKWKNACFGKSKIIVEWHIPDTAPTGTYRISHSGYRKKLWEKEPVPYPGDFSEFEVV